MKAWSLILLAAIASPATTGGFVFPKCSSAVHPARTSVSSVVEGAGNEDASYCRRSFVSSILGSGLVLVGFPRRSQAEEEESFASIAARAAQLSSEVGEKTTQVVQKSDDPRTAYDFDLPVGGETLKFGDIVHQEYDAQGRARVKAILVVNMKEDDPIARKDIPEFMSLASK